MFLLTYRAGLQVQSRSFDFQQTFADDDEYSYNFREFLNFCFTIEFLYKTHNSSTFLRCCFFYDFSFSRN